MLRRFLRGSSSQSSKEKAPKPKYNLPRTAEIRACEWPSEDFLRAAGIHNDFTLWLMMRASPTSSTTSSNSISYSLILSCKNFTFTLRNHRKAIHTAEPPRCEANYIWASVLLHSAFPSSFDSMSP